MKSKIVKIVFVVVIILNMFSVLVNADDININDWKPSNTGSNTKLSQIGGRILGVIQVGGTVISIIALIIIGFKYMCGSIEEKVQYRKTMVPYLVGSIMLFAITNIVGFIYFIATNI